MSGIHLNDPKINRKYNYLYKLTNLVNNKIYIGVHRTDNIEDNYMGSGLIIKRSIKKYGRDKFEKEIIQFFPTYQEALDAERDIVTEQFIERDDVYNVKEGGYGNCKWSRFMLDKLSKSAKELWKNEGHRQMMREKCFDNPERNKKLGKNVSKWIKNNPDKHKIRMDKINKNPEKIKKMAETHRGMKRSEEACENISEGIKNIKITNPEGAKRRCGKGSKYIHNPLTKEIKRISKTDSIPEGWKAGSGKKPKDSYKYLNKGSFFGHDPLTGKTKRFQKDDNLPDGWVKGRLSKKKI